jgi:hypothetical protein
MDDDTPPKCDVDFLYQTIVCDLYLHGARERETFKDILEDAISRGIKPTKNPLKFITTNLYAYSHTNRCGYPYTEEVYKFIIDHGFPIHASILTSAAVRCNTIAMKVFLEYGISKQDLHGLIIYTQETRRDCILDMLLRYQSLRAALTVFPDIVVDEMIADYI